jgi:DNA-binding CsgD family transcriptional regulator
MESITLKKQMETVFLHGLKVIQMNEQEVLKEWMEVVTYLQNVDKKLKDNTENTIQFFNHALFNKELDGKNLLSSWKECFPNIPKTSPFILTLLENAIHKVLQKQSINSYHDHQAIQYLFTVISENMLSQPYNRHFSMEVFLKQLVSSQQLPIEWIAKVKRHQKQYIVEEWFHDFDQHVLVDNKNLKADTLYTLSDLLLNQLQEEKRKQYTIIPIPIDDRNLLVCTNKEDASQMIPFITYVLEIIQKTKETIKLTKEEYFWKDSVIMFNETIMRSQTFDDALENITSGFVNFLPFERCALFSYSYNEQMGFGLYGHRLDNEAIQSITENITNLPIIQNNLQILQMFGKNINYLQPMYLKDASEGFPVHYVSKFRLRSVVIAPIFTSSTNKLLGAAILDQGPNKYFKVSKHTFSALIKFGQSAGEILAKFYKDESIKILDKKAKTLHFSPREVEVLKLMAEGASTTEAAHQLNLSEYTVRDYVSAIMHKMDARNRTEAVARAIREGII